MQRVLGMLVAMLPGCWEGHDSCGIAPPAGYGVEADVAPPPAPPPWTAGRIEDALRIDPAPVMKTLSRGHPLIVADTDAGTLRPVCDQAALRAVSEFADELGPHNEPPACSEIAALHDTRTLVCVRPHDGRSVVALAFFRRGEDWDLTVLLKGDQPDANVNQDILSRLPELSCP